MIVFVVVSKDYRILGIFPNEVSATAFQNICKASGSFVDKMELSDATKCFSRQ